MALVLVACVVAFTWFGGPTPFGVGPALVIGAIWYFGFAKHRQPQERATSSAEAGAAPVGTVPTQAPAFVAHQGPATPFTEAAEAWRRRIEEHLRVNGSDPVPATEPPSWPAPPAVPAPAALQDPDPELNARTAFLAEPDPVGLYADPPPVPAGAPPLPRPRGDRVSARRLRLLTLLVLGLTTGGLALADHGGLAVPPVVYAASALLSSGSPWSRPTWWAGPRPVGYGSPARPRRDRHRRGRSARPAGGLGQRDVPLRDSGGAAADRRCPPRRGELVLDLSGLTLDADAVHSARVGTGRLEVVVPRDVNVTVHYDVDQGAVQPYRGDERIGSQLVGTLPPPTLVPGRRR